MQLVEAEKNSPKVSILPEMALEGLSNGIHLQKYGIRNDTIFLCISFD